MAANVGAFFGFLLAAGGVGYLWLGILWSARIYKRWPGQSYWSAIGVTIIIGMISAVSSGELALYGTATAVAAAYMFWRSRRVSDASKSPLHAG